MEIKPTIKTYKVNIEAGFNYGYRAGAMCDNDDENKAEIIKTKEIEAYENWLNNELTKAFEMGIEYNIRMSKKL